MELQAFFLGPLANHIHQIVQQGADRILYRDYLHLAGFNLGKVQNIIDQPQKRRPGSTDILRVFTGVFLLCLTQNHFIHAQHRIDRCTDFMAHVGQKLALGNAGSLGGMRHFQQFLIGCRQFMRHRIQKSRHPRR